MKDTVLGCRFDFQFGRKSGNGVFFFKVRCLKPVFFLLRNNLFIGTDMLQVLAWLGSDYSIRSKSIFLLKNINRYF